MRIALFGATGQLGSMVTHELLTQGHPVSVLVRNRLKLHDQVPDEDVVEADVRDPNSVLKCLKGVQSVVSTLGMADISVPATDLSDCLKAIVEGMKEVGVRRIVAVGGASVLPHPDGGLNKDHDWPSYLKYVGEEHERQWKILCGSGLDWTLVCPVFFNDEVPGATYRVAREALPPNSDMVTIVNLADFLVREVSRNEYLHTRVGIVSDRPLGQALVQGD